MFFPLFFEFVSYEMIFRYRCTKRWRWQERYHYCHLCEAYEYRWLSCTLDKPTLFWIPLGTPTYAGAGQLVTGEVPLVSIIPKYEVDWSTAGRGGPAGATLICCMLSGSTAGNTGTGDR